MQPAPRQEIRAPHRSRRIAVSLCLSLAFAACFSSEFAKGLPCETQDDCGPQLECLNGLCGGVGDTPVCGNWLLEQDEQCDDGNLLTGDLCDPDCRFPAFQLPLDNRNVDILFVVDNSGSMANVQANLATSIDGLVEVLELANADYHLGLTTTDSGNPWCPTSAPNLDPGNLVFSSCRSRLDDFLYDTDGVNEVDARDFACNDICPEELDQLQIIPTTTEVDGNPAPRPWLENIEGQLNVQLPPAFGVGDVLRCVVPQGINGCGFESQLESMFLALDRATVVDQGTMGFLREGAALAIVHVTDEVDCSANPSWAEIFDPLGSKVFWSDPADALPTSAVCWNAGVQCTGDPSGYDSCDTVDKDVSGNITTDPDAAVLYPLSRYTESLQEIENAKQLLDANQEVIVALIAGVGLDGMANYSDGNNPLFLHDFGIGSGCISAEDPGLDAVPPVRLRDFVEDFTPGNRFSVCGLDHTLALQTVANQIVEQMQVEPGCFPYCAKNFDTESDIVVPMCEVTQATSDGEDDSQPVQACERADDGIDYVLPVSVDVCYVALVASEMSQSCKDLNHNLQIELIRRPGVEVPSTTKVLARCILAPPEQCPHLGSLN